MLGKVGAYIVMPSDLDCIFFVQKPPRVTFEDGMFRVCFAIGKRATIEVVMSPNTFFKMRQSGAEIAAKWQVDSLDKVKAIPRH